MLLLRRSSGQLFECSKLVMTKFKILRLVLALRTGQQNVQFYADKDILRLGFVRKNCRLVSPVYLFELATENTNFLAFFIIDHLV